MVPKTKIIEPEKNENQAEGKQEGRHTAAASAAARARSKETLRTQGWVILRSDLFYVPKEGCSC